MKLASRILIASIFFVTLAQRVVAQCSQTNADGSCASSKRTAVCPSYSTPSNTTTIYVCAQAAFRVVHVDTAGDVPPESLVVVGYEAPFPKFTVTVSDTTAEVATATLTASVELVTGTVTFLDTVTSRVIGAESTTAFSPSSIEPGLLEVTQGWAQDVDEAVYGGGMYQNGFFNWKDTMIDMVQYNTETSVPFFVSTKGYGILWEGYSATRMNGQGTAIPLEHSISSSRSGVYTGTLTTGVEGAYNFLVSLCTDDFGCDSRDDDPPYPVSLTVSLTDGVETVYAQSTLDQIKMVSSMAARAHLKANTRYVVSVDWDPTLTPTLTYNAPNLGEFLLTSYACAVIDYHFMYGGSIDGSIRLYREATGPAPIYPKKAYGLWSSRNKYDNQSELLENAQRYRDEYIPVDSIVQDWFYWGDLGWGPHWDASTFPDPAAMVAAVHDLDINFMVSVWSRFDEETPFYQAMNAGGFIVGSSTYYDPFHADARELFYNFSNDAHFSIGVDSLWMDATEPEDQPQKDAQYSIGPGNQYFLAYSLESTRATAEGLRRDYRDAQGARVFTLTRSSFTGQQRVGAVYWSGDNVAQFDVLRRQIVGSVNYQLSGIPYWTDDTGGFWRPDDQYTNEAYKALQVRWYQFNAFTPIFRLHGTGNTEPWNYGEEFTATVNRSAIAFRYRFLPYIYSGFREVEMRHTTFQRALVFDFASDEATHDIADEYMFGEALLVAPVYTAGDPAVRDVYFPVDSAWVDFYTGEGIEGGQTLAVRAPLSQIPLYFRAGSIVVLGSVVQHALEPAPVLEVRVIDGADARFVLYEDDGLSPTVDVDGLQPVDVAHSIIEFAWSTSRRQLSIGERVGKFPGMLGKRVLNIFLVREGHGVGLLPTSPDHVVTYDGRATVVSF